MEKRRRVDIPPDEKMRKRTKKVGVVGVSALSAMGTIAGVQAASAERQITPVASVVSAEDVHGVRDDIQTPTSVIQSDSEESLQDEGRDPSAEPQDDKKGNDNEETAAPEAEPEYQEPAQWWPTGVKQNWLLIQKVAQEHNVDPYIIATIATEESRGINIVNGVPVEQNTSIPQGATGPMQIEPETFAGINKLRNKTNMDIINYEQNLDAAAWLINDIDKKYISDKGIKITSDFGWAVLENWYGEYSSDAQNWTDSGYNPNYLTPQSRHVIPIWIELYKNIHNSAYKLEKN